MKNRLVRKIGYSLAVLCMAVTLFHSPTDVWAASGSVTFGSESYEAEENGEFLVGVYLKADSQMSSYHVEVEYDKSRIEYTGGAESESDGVITLEGTGVSDEIKYMLSFKTISGGNAYVKVKRAYIYSAESNNTELFDMTELDEADIKIAGEDTGTERKEEEPEYVAPFETDIPHVEPSIQLNNVDYYVVDSNLYVPESVSWDYTLVPGKLGDMDVTFISNQSRDIFFLSLIDANDQTHLYSYSQSQKQLYECDFYNTGDSIYYYTSPYACDNWPDELSLDIVRDQGVCYALRNDGQCGFYTVETDGLKPWDASAGEEYSDNQNRKLVIALIIIVLVLAVVFVLAYFMTREALRRKRRRKKFLSRREMDKRIEQGEFQPEAYEGTTADDLAGAQVDKQTSHLNEKGEEPVISVRNVTMKFKVSNSSASGIKDFLIQKLKGQINYKELYALDDVSFDVYKGEVVGIIGTNGSGKSTMLRIVSGALHPSSGEVQVDRRKVQLLTLGTGFDMELTARENIYLNGAIIGYSKKFLDEHFDEIIDFAELHEFVDEKVKNFSSGMVSRLGFAIATAGDAAEILILDEVLSVGDEFFRKKSLARVKEMIHGGSTVLMVSHGMGTIIDNCSKVVWIEKGKLQMVGEARDVCKQYQALGNA